MIMKCTRFGIKHVGITFDVFKAFASEYLIYGSEKTLFLLVFEETYQSYLLTSNLYGAQVIKIK